MGDDKYRIGLKVIVDSMYSVYVSEGVLCVCVSVCVHKCQKINQ